MKKLLSICVAVILSLSFSLPVNAATTEVSVIVPTNTLSVGDTFTVSIMVSPLTPIAGMQANLSFNPWVLEAVQVQEGNLFNRNGGLSYFVPGSTNNTTGAVNNMAGVILGANQSVTTAGVFVTVTFRVKGSGDSALTLSNTVVG